MKFQWSTVTKVCFLLILRAACTLARAKGYGLALCVYSFGDPG